uniref:Uncharacterized protein n=1 Tax=Arundo donax TaxID=35708 RepID=A0A0A9TTW5_ARUDO
MPCFLDRHHAPNCKHISTSFHIYLTSQNQCCQPFYSLTVCMFKLWDNCVLTLTLNSNCDFALIFLTL